MRHHPGCLPHEFADRARQVRTAGVPRVLAMADFIVTHGFDDGAAAQVGIRQQVEMALQMTFYLSLGLGHEPQAGSVAE